MALLWSAIFITVSVLYRPVEQLLSRTIADRDARGVTGSEHLRVAATIQLVLGVAFAVAALAFRTPLQDDLFNGSATLYWILIAAVLAYAASYFARGFLAGHRRFALYGGLVLMESVSRFLFALAVTVGVAEGQTVVALGMAAAPAGVARGGGAGARGVPHAWRAQPAAGAGSAARPGRGRRPRGARRARVHALPRLRLRARRAGDHAGRADLPQRRPVAGEGHRGRPRRGAGRVRLQRAAAGPRAARALPGRADLDPPPPHPPLGRGRRRGRGRRGSHSAAA